MTKMLLKCVNVRVLRYLFTSFLVVVVCLRSKEYRSVLQALQFIVRKHSTESFYDDCVLLRKVAVVDKTYTAPSHNFSLVIYQCNGLSFTSF